MKSNSMAPVKKTKSKGSTQNGDEFNEITASDQRTSEMTKTITGLRNTPFPLPSIQSPEYFKVLKDTQQKLLIFSL